MMEGYVRNTTLNFAVSRSRNGDEMTQFELVVKVVAVVLFCVPKSWRMAKIGGLA
jgi:hypothetical protein